MDETPGFTTKEIVLKIWEELGTFKKEVRERLDQLEGARDRSYWPRQLGTIAATGVVAATISAIVAQAVGG